VMTIHEHPTASEQTTGALPLSGGDRRRRPHSPRATRAGSVMEAAADAGYLRSLAVPSRTRDSRHGRGSEYSPASPWSPAVAGGPCSASPAWRWPARWRCS
jgi:hypothetical protein